MRSVMASHESDVAIRDILLAAREEYGRAETKRLEKVFLEYAGIRAPSLSPHPLQRPGVFCDSLGLRPWYEPDEFPAARILEENFETIRDEVLSAPRETFQGYDDGIAAPERWGVIFVRYGSAPVERNRPYFPRTVEVVDSLPRAGQMSMVSVIKPQTHLEPHCGPMNMKVTVHLALDIPVGCALTVAGETRPWVEGKCLVFDDSFEHEAWNRSDRARWVLLVDLWHPDLTDAEMDIMDRTMRVLGRWSRHIDDGHGRFLLGDPSGA